MDSSTSIAIRLRNNIVVGFMYCSPSEITGNSSGKPPRRPHAALHGVGHLPQVRVAVVQLAERIANADHRLAVERLARNAEARTFARREKL